MTCRCRPAAAPCKTAGLAAIAYGLGIVTALLLSCGAGEVLLALCAFCAAAALLK